MFASGASNPRSGLDIDAEHGSGRADPEDVDLPSAIGSRRPDNVFLNCRTSDMLSFRRSRRRSHRGKSVRRRGNLEPNDIFFFRLQAVDSAQNRQRISLEMFGVEGRKFGKVWRGDGKAWRVRPPPRRDSSFSRSDRRPHSAVTNAPASALAISARVSATP